MHGTTLCIGLLHCGLGVSLDPLHEISSLRPRFDHDGLLRSAFGGFERTLRQPQQHGEEGENADEQEQERQGE
jgi:hypothetical protein